MIIEHVRVNAKRGPTYVAWLRPNSCLLEAGMKPTDRHKIRPDIMLKEMIRSELMGYNTGGMDPTKAVDYHQ